jgi:hypothetical protein
MQVLSPTNMTAGHREGAAVVYRLDELAELARELGLVSERVSADRLDVIIRDGYRLAFCNLPSEGDTLGAA